MVFLPENLPKAPPRPRKKPEEGGAISIKLPEGNSEGHVGMDRPKEGPSGQEMPEAELKRRERIAKTLRWAAQADESYALLVQQRKIASGLEGSKARNDLATIEAMSAGQEISRKALGDEEGGSVNVVTKRVYEGREGKVLGFAKSALGDPSFYLNEKGMVRRVRTAQEDGSPKTSEDVYLDVSDGFERSVVEVFKKKIAEFPKRREEIAAAYGISPEEVHLDPEDFGPREGIPVGDSAVREWGASRVDSILGLNVVPPVALRSESGGADMVSVQEGVKAYGGELSTMAKSEFDAIARDGARHPMAESMMRMAVLDYLIKSSDRHPRNLMSSSGGRTLSAIDNGLSFGLSKKTNDGKVVPVDEFRSLPMEASQSYNQWARSRGGEEWKLDAISHKALSDVLEEWKKAKSGGEIGPAVRTLSQVFRVVYGENVAISKVEVRQFFDRLEHVVANGRPPDMKIGNGPGELLPMSQNVGLYG